MKIKISGSEYSDTNLEGSVCSHLEPILNKLEEHGAKWDKSQKLKTDKGGAYTLKLKTPIDFNLIEDTFEIPHFIEISKEFNSIICRRCWCDIEGK